MSASYHADDGGDHQANKLFGIEKPGDIGPSLGADRYIERWSEWSNEMAGYAAALRAEQIFESAPNSYSKKSNDGGLPNGSDKCTAFIRTAYLGDYPPKPESKNWLFRWIDDNFPSKFKGVDIPYSAKLAGENGHIPGFHRVSIPRPGDVEILNSQHARIVGTDGINRIEARRDGLVKGRVVGSDVKTTEFHRIGEDRRRYKLYP